MATPDPEVHFVQKRFSFRSNIAEVATAKPAIEIAVAMASTSNGTIRLIYVRSMLPVTYMEFVLPEVDVEQQRQSEEKLASIAADVALPKERISIVVSMGSVYNAVLREAEKLGADLIIVGSHRPTMVTYLLGSNAATIVRHATHSVLVVR